MGQQTMIKLTCVFLICLAVSSVGVPINANSFGLEKYAWTNRLIILVTDKKSAGLKKQAEIFFEKHFCGVSDRNLKLLHFRSDKVAKTLLPKIIGSKTGMWLIGYDGLIKDFSEDKQLLDRLFQTIDTMPMRQNEIKTGPVCE